VYHARTYAGTPIDRSVSPSIDEIQHILLFIYHQPYLPNVCGKRDSRVSELLKSSGITFAGLFPEPQYMGPN
jgi:hypothetical protein